MLLVFFKKDEMNESSEISIFKAESLEVEHRWLNLDVLVNSFTNRTVDFPKNTKIDPVHSFPHSFQERIAV